MLNTIINHADTVKIACLAQLVNVIAPIMTEPNGRAWVQTIYYPFLYASRYGRGTSLKLRVDSPSYSCAVGDDIPFIDSAAVLSADEREITLFLINRSLDQQQECRISLSSLLEASVLECVSLNGFRPKSVNTADAAPVRPAPLGDYSLHEGVLAITLPALSWNMVRIKNGRE
jgi:alpha-N-arabinofuranosidase